jgi:hypothetical protein
VRRLVYFVGLAAITLGLYGYAALVAGKPTGSAVFLGLSGGVLFISIGLLYRAARSLFEEPPAGDLAVATGRRRKELEREKTAILKALKELEFDHEMGKVSDADFVEIGGIYRGRAIRVMRRLDDRQMDYAAIVEEELKKARRGVTAESAASPEAKPESSSPVTGPSPVGPSPVGPSPVGLGASPSCGSCGSRNDADAVFCKKCAARLAPVEGVA